ncbi:uncharacterized protein BO80DRAFT_92316 [Aspergillus ibericus CBS 121593]|uniref:Uncharacterized protein n=1 Tax=Aspergillus ibericus CBS 121593 TaxID=1448316 RepID=A0A395GZ29_9EURO|nr:hypothetical protein BO80DRAFT_92316 [Aspergillus ibericus CBS 121593]RAL00583.1 hypothetical protein BO80DRAFT_92316 [Aspergillus ibericus CBS 121593]
MGKRESEGEAEGGSPEMLHRLRQASWSSTVTARLNCAPSPTCSPSSALVYLTVWSFSTGLALYLHSYNTYAFPATEFSLIPPTYLPVGASA